MIRVLLVWLMLALPAVAQQMPALFDVTGVAADDTLNIRAEPDAAAPVLGTLPSDRRGIEVLALNDTGRWGQININEGTGWVSMAFLRPQFPGPSPLPARFVCYGTEPFWRADVEQNGQSYFAQPMEEPRAFATGPLVTAAGRQDTYALSAEGAAFVVRRAACNDGMSDRAYGLSVDLLLTAPGALYSGCCTLEQ